MSRFKYIFFDLDGTIYRSGDGIKKSAEYALKKFGIIPECETELERFIGPPLKKSFIKYYGLNSYDAEKAITFFREYYSEKGIFEGNIYNGITDLLKFIDENEMIAVVATSKPELYANKILEHFGVKKYFTLISGASFDESLVEKYDIIMNAISKLGINDTSQILMVGDRKYDIIGGKQAGTSTVGVLFGYGSHNELYSANADYIVSYAKEIVKILL